MPRFNRTNSLGRVFGIREDRAVLFAVTKPDPIYLESKMKTCCVEGCDKKHKAKGYCKRHYQQMYQSGKISERTPQDPHEFITEGDMCTFQVYNKNSQPKCQVIIDTEDYNRVKEYKWYSSRHNEIRNDTVGALGRFILGVSDKKLQVDHINHDRLDNRKKNLRVSTHTENNQNKKKTVNNTSGFKGVYLNKRDNIFIAEIVSNGQWYGLGRFSRKEDAALAYNKAALKYHGEFACLNEIPSRRFKRIF